MKNKLIIAALLIFTFCFTANAQTDEAARRIQLVQALERTQEEISSSRRFIAALKEQVESKENLISSLNKKDGLSGSAIKSLQDEVVSLRAAIDAQEKVVSLQKEESKYLRRELEKTRKDLSRSRRRSKFLIIAAGILAVFVIAK
jgi:uncharacterized membrane protein YvbJ